MHSCTGTLRAYELNFCQHDRCLGGQRASRPLLVLLRCERPVIQAQSIPADETPVETSFEIVRWRSCQTRRGRGGSSSYRRTREGAWSKPSGIYGWVGCTYRPKALARQRAAGAGFRPEGHGACGRSLQSGGRRWGGGQASWQHGAPPQRQSEVELTRGPTAGRPRRPDPCLQSVTREAMQIVRRPRRHQ